MYRFLFPFLLLLDFSGVFGQSTEFMTYESGLIYSEHTMGLLSQTVDSLNQHYKSCDLDRALYSNYQTVATHFILKGDRAKTLSKDLKNNVPFEQIKAEYTGLELQSVLLVEDRYEDYNGVEQVELFSMDLENGSSLRFSFEAEEYDRQEKIYYRFLDGEYVSTPYLVGFYISTPFSRQLLNEKISFLVGYADCLIDTTNIPEPEAVDRFNYSADWIMDFSEYNKSEKNMLLSHLLAQEVVGFCSQDSRPRIHAMNITRLAAETGSWEIFLRSHLNIMNDRFDRASDGSYAWGARKTYIRELEELGINVPDLMLGLTFRMSNPSQNHYFGSVNRLGRALAESQFLDDIYARALKHISDPKLDDFNRLVMVFLCRNIIHHIEDENAAEIRRSDLRNAVDTLPDYLKRAR
ncbi:MAG: hypothetical protein AAF741_04260 [Bacteroidota bacterium]